MEDATAKLFKRINATLVEFRSGLSGLRPDLKPTMEKTIADLEALREKMLQEEDPPTERLQ